MEPYFYELLTELFLDPFIEQLFQNYKEKNLENKYIVELLILCAQQSNLYYSLINFIDPKIKNTKTDQIISALEGLWKIYWNKVDFSKVYNGQIYPHRITNFCDKKFAEDIDKYYGINPPKEKIMNEEDYNLEINKCMDFIFLHLKNKIVS